MVITTKSGYEIEVKNSLTFGEMRSLQKELFTGVKSEIGKQPEIDFSRLLEYTEKAFPFLIVSITKNGQKLTSNLLEEVNSWELEDGQLVFDTINEIITPNQDKKK